MKPYNILEVNRWTNENTKKKYIFNTNESDIKNIIYNDDNIFDAINKIGLYIQKFEKLKKSNIYAWVDNICLSFTIDKIKWDGYNINPFKSNNRNDEKLKEQIIYNYDINSRLFNYKSINIIFYNDLNDELKNNKYYFVERNIPSLKEYEDRDKLLSELDKTDISKIKNTFISIHRYDLISYNNIKSLSDIFDNIKTNKYISFIQWLNDPYKILYKLNKKHNISYDKLNNWTNIDKIINFKCINLYSMISINSYCKITINDNGIINFSYIINLRDGITIDIINKNKNILIKLLENSIKQPIKLKELSLKVNLTFEQINSNINLLIKKLGKYIDIFQNVKLTKEKNKNLINCVYKRTSFYTKQGLNISDYIISRINLGIPTNEILTELNNFNINKEEGLKLIEEQLNLIENNENIKNISEKSTDTFLIIENYNNGYNVHVLNIPSNKELNYLIYWLLRVFALSYDETLAKKKIIVIPNKKSTSSKKSSSSSKKSLDDDLGKLDIDDLDDIEIEGGALGKEKHSYFVNLLQQADNELFKNNYAREKCQSNFQPIVLSSEKKKELIDTNNFHFDNYIEYGSSKDIKNTYACPRLWCPDSKIPLNPDDPNAKCPNENEEPMKLFFDNDKNKKRYVNLIKPDEKDLCVPCCFKKQPKEENLNKCKFYNNKEDNNKQIKDVKNSSIIDNDNSNLNDDNYIVNQKAPINIGRYGLIPKTLHELLYPKVDFVLCSKTINKNEKCFVRKGINHKSIKKNKLITNDSLIYAISYILNFKNKDDFIKDVKKRLDLITFLSLENGNVCKDFMDKLPLIPNENKILYKNLLLFLNKNNKIYFNIDDTNDYNISRILGIYKSYIKYIDYLSSDDFPTNKSSYYLYSLIKELYNTLLVIWEKSNDNINIICPYYTCFEDLIASMDLNPNIIMLLKDNKFYEPIELKIKNKDGEKFIKLNDFPNIKKLTKECSILKNNYDYNLNIFNNLLSINLWINTKLLKNYNKFNISTILINNNMTLSHFITKSNIIIITKPISISFLPNLIKNLKIDSIKFYDDLIDIDFKVKILKSDLILIDDKIKLYDFNINIGIINIENDIEIRSTISLKKLSYDNNIIHSRKIDDLYLMSKEINNNDKRWFELKKYICKTLLKNKINNFDKIFIYDKYFIKHPDSSKIKIILEEMPLYSLDYINNYLNNLIYNKYNFNDSKIKEKDNEFIFSQLSLINGIPDKFLIYHKSYPNIKIADYDIKDYILKPSDIKIDNIKLPSIFIGTFEKLKTKWIMHKKSKWSNMIIIKNNYNIDTIKHFYIWLSSYLKINIDYNDVIKLSNHKLITIYNNENAMMEILNDPSYFNELNIVSNKKYKNIQLFYNNFYNNLSNNEKLFFINKVINSNKLFPNDLTILSISEILNINILMIHRGKYGGVHEKNNFVRGDIDDLVLSSTFYKAKNDFEDRPLIIFNKSYDNNKSVYSLIIEKINDSDIITGIDNIYIMYKNSPLNVKYLIEAHLSLK